MTLIEQLQAERRARAAEANEATRAQVDPNRYRSDADRARLAATDAGRIAAEEAFNDALRANLAAEKAVQTLTKGDAASLFYRDLQPSYLTPAARAYVDRGRETQEAVKEAREQLQKATRAHNVAVREVDASAAARRRQAKREGKL